MIRGHYLSYNAISSAISLFHFLTLIKLYTWECENTAMKQNNPITEEKISDCAVYLTNFFSFLKTDHIFIIELHFCSLNLKAETMCQKWWVVVCHADPCAKSVQYLDLLNTLIFPKIFSTGDILTLVDHTLINHTACISLANGLPQVTNPLPFFTLSQPLRMK